MKSLEKISIKSRVTILKVNPALNIHLHIFDCDVDPGNSGSPAFFDLVPRREPAERDSNPLRVSLAGIVKGGFGTTLSAIIPSYLLRDILFRDDVVADRNRDLENNS